MSKLRSPDVRTLRPGFKVGCMKLPLYNQLYAVTGNYLDIKNIFSIRMLIEELNVIRVMTINLGSIVIEVSTFITFFKRSNVTRYIVVHCF